MNTIDLTNYDFPNNREELRRKLVNILDEAPGTGKGKLASRNRYIVKNIGDHVVYLQRPARFNNGFDFTVNVSGINFNAQSYNEKGKLKRSTTRVNHSHIFRYLASKKKENLALYEELVIQIDRIYNCEVPNKLKFNFNAGYDSEIILECIKWLFAEQDITYWNYLGRLMFYRHIQKFNAIDEG